jgi:hypothetical protein
VKLPPETIHEISQSEPLCCPYCADAGHVNQMLSIFDAGAEATLVGAVLACSHGHAYLLALGALGGRVFLGFVAVEYAGPVLADLARA